MDQGTLVNIFRKATDRFFCNVDINKVWNCVDEFGYPGKTPGISNVLNGAFQNVNFEPTVLFFTPYSSKGDFSQGLLFSEIGIISIHNKKAVIILWNEITKIEYLPDQKIRIDYLNTKPLPNKELNKNYSLIIPFSLLIKDESTRERRVKGVIVPMMQLYWNLTLALSKGQDVNDFMSKIQGPTPDEAYIVNKSSFGEDLKNIILGGAVLAGSYYLLKGLINDNQKYETCPVCDGSGNFYGSCSICQGKGKVLKTKSDHGVSIVADKETFMYPDEYVQRGLIAEPKCPICHGSGRCTACAGRGWKSTVGVYDANTHVYDCSICKGTGTCNLCYGRGSL